MRPVKWLKSLSIILTTALLAAVAASSLPDDPYQRWQLVAGTLYDNARWSYERIHFDPRPVDVAIIGASRSQIGLSAPRIAAQLTALGKPAEVANMSIIEDGRNIEWAVVDELYKTKRPKVLVILVSEEFNRWGHPGFKYVAPSAAVAWPPAPFLHNWGYDIVYLPYRQMKLFAASLFPATFGLRREFDRELYARSPTDFSVSRRLADGKYLNMDRVRSAEDLEAEAREYKSKQKPSRVPKVLQGVTDADNPTYVTEIAQLAAAHGTRLVFVLLPEFNSRGLQGRDFYARLGTIQDNGDLARHAELFQSFSHLNHAGAVIASDRVAATVARLL